MESCNILGYNCYSKKKIVGSRIGNHFKTICGYEFGALKILYT